MEILKVEKITDEKWLNLFAATYRHDGRTGRWVFASRKEHPHDGSRRADAVVIVPVLVNPGEPPRLVLEKEFRAPVGDYVIGFPAGLLEPGESIEDTVKRELFEETGMEVVRVKRVTGALYSSSGMSDESAAMVFVDVRSTPETRQHLEGPEDIEVLLLDHAGVCRLCDDTSARIDVKVWTTLYMYQQLGKLA
jgi:ADP-ribose pyrophosphatase